MATAADRKQTTWKCELCSQSVLLDVDGTPWFPPGFAENCPLKDHMIGYECIAFRDRERAQRLLALGDGTGSTLTFDDQVVVDESRRVGRSWLRDTAGISRVRVEVSWEVAEDFWRVDCQDRDALKAEFKERRDRYRDVAIREAQRHQDFYVYAIRK